MEEKSVLNVTANDFEEQVIRASEERLVVVDFWAPWCAPCLMLTPILEGVVQSHQGQVLLAKVNVEENPELASGYGIQSIPAVKMFYQGKVVSEFIGALPEREVQRALDAALPSEADNLAAEADSLEKGQPSDAEERYRKVLAKEPDHPMANLKLAEMALGKGNLDEAEQFAAGIASGAAEHAEASIILNQVYFRKHCQQMGGREAAAAQLDKEQSSLEAQFDLACCLAAEEDYEKALEALLKIVTSDKDHGNGAAKDAMVRIFALVGETSALVHQYRPQLAQALY